MSHGADRLVVVLDANVLYPFRVRDVLLRFAEAGLYRVCWSHRSLDEWCHHLLDAKPHLAASISQQRAAMDRAFPEALIEGHEPLIAGLSLPDADDRHVLAAAIQAGAQHIVTENLRDFPNTLLATYGIEAVSADAFLSALGELYPLEAMAALRCMRHSYKRSAMSPSELVMDLTRVGLPLTAALAESHIYLI